LVNEPARDSGTAWRKLCEAGGLELNGRDADFQDQLRTRLSPTAATLGDALRGASTDDLVRAGSLKYEGGLAVGALGLFTNLARSSACQSIQLTQ